MPRPCSICIHGDLEEINHLILNGESHREIARQFGLSHDSVTRHSKSHIKESRQPPNSVSRRKAQITSDSQSNIKIMERKAMPKSIGNIEIPSPGRPIAKKSIFTITPEQAVAQDFGHLNPKPQKIQVHDERRCPKCNKISHWEALLELESGEKLCTYCYEDLKAEAYRSDGFVRGLDSANKEFWFKTSAEIKPLMHFWEGKKLIEVTVDPKDCRPAIISQEADAPQEPADELPEIQPIPTSKMSAEDINKVLVDAIATVRRHKGTIVLPHLQARLRELRCEMDGEEIVARMEKLGWIREGWWIPARFKFGE